MKAKRRQELKTNDLAQWLEDMRISFREWGVYVVAGIAIVVIAAVIVSYRGTAKQDAVRENYATLASLSRLAPEGSTERRTDEEMRQALNEISQLAANSSDRDFKLDALIRKGELGLQLAEQAQGGIDQGFLNDARDAFKTVAEGYQGQTIHVGRALFGLFQVEADLFAADGDIRHKAEAKSYLEKLRDDERLRGTPYQTRAIDLLNDLDAMFTQVNLPPRPAPEPPKPITMTPAVTPSAGIPNPATASVTLSGGEDAEEESSSAADDAGDVPAEDTADDAAAETNEAANDEPTDADAVDPAPETEADNTDSDS